MKLSKLLSQPKGKVSKAIPTGLDSLDQIIGGLHPGHIYTIAGRPAMGCSTFAITIARNISIFNKVPTVFFSFDLPEDNIVERLFAAEYGWHFPFEQFSMINETTKASDGLNNLDDEMRMATALMERNGWHTEVEQQKMLNSPENYIQLMKEAPLWIEHNLDFTGDEIICRIERMKKNDNIQVVIIDGLWWLITSQTFTERELLMQKIAQAAKKLNIAILLTTVLNRDVELRGGDKKPMLHDIRGGLCSEVYSSVIMLLYRAEYYGFSEDFEGNPTEGVVDVVVVKNAFGETAETKLKFRGSASFEEIENKSLEDTMQDLSNELKYLNDLDYPF